jgi:hypothetical protein
MLAKWHLGEEAWVHIVAVARMGPFRPGTMYPCTALQHLVFTNLLSIPPLCDSIFCSRAVGQIAATL